MKGGTAIIGCSGGVDKSKSWGVDRTIQLGLGWFNFDLACSGNLSWHIKGAEHTEEIIHHTFIIYNEPTQR